MKILFDHQIFYKKYGGASKYFVMLLDSMLRESWETTTLLSGNPYVEAKRLFRTCRYRFRGQPRLLEYANRPYTNYRLRQRDFDVFHQTDFGVYCLNSLGNKPMVTTFHDTNLSTHDPHPEIVKLQMASLARANAVIAVSENTKRDMLELFDIDEKKIHVVYHGIEQPDLGQLPAARIFVFPYVLYVGRRSQYKNFQRFAEAFSVLHSKYPEIHCVCTSVPFNHSERETFAKLGIQDCMHSIFADEKTMLVLYRDACVFVFPSIYEGFGMPILEAWSCHCPVVLSNASCFPEIAGDAGLFFEATDVDDMAEKMEKAVADSHMREHLIAKGDERVKLFSWKRCAEKHVKVYESLT